MKKFLLNSKTLAFALLLVLTTSLANAATYYTSNNSAPEALTSWWTNTNGTGSHPANFTTAGDIFIVQTGDVPAQVATWTVAGTVQINSGGNLSRTVLMTIGGNLIINGTMTNANANSCDVAGNVSGTGTITAGATNRIFNVSGNWTFSGTITNGDDIRINMIGSGNQTLSGTISNGANAGILEINKTAGVVTLGSAFNTGGGTFILTAGTFDPSTFLLTATTRTFTAGTLRVGATTFAGNYSGAITEPAAGTIEYNAAGNQTVNDIAYPGNLTLSGGSTKTWTLAATRIVTGDLTINSGSTLTLAGSQTLSAKGDFVNGGTFNQGTTIMTLTGAAAQAITATAATTFAGLTIANTSGGVALTGNATVSGTLTLTSGVLTINTGSKMILSAGTVIAGTPFSATKYISTLANTSTGAVGALEVDNITSASSYVFPVGTNSAGTAYYLPVTLKPSGTTANNDFTVTTFKGMTDDGTPNGPASLQSNIVNAVWSVTYGGGSTAPAVDMTMNWPDALEGTNFSSYPNTLIGISHYSSVLGWESYDLNGGTATNGTTNIATRLAVTTFSPFSVGKLGTAFGALPIKITYFNVSKGTNSNTINWSAETSSSSVTFDIERSSDGVNFKAINSITASMARTASPFSVDDAAPLAGTNFYRIKMIDIDGRITYTSIVRVGNAPKSIELVGVVPNPVVNAAQLSITTTKKDNIEVAVISLDGRVMSKQSVQLQNGSSLVSLDVSKLAAGTYFVKGTFSDGTANSVKFVKQ